MKVHNAGAECVAAANHRIRDECFAAALHSIQQFAVDSVQMPLGIGFAE